MIQSLLLEECFIILVNFNFLSRICFKKSYKPFSDFSSLVPGHLFWQDWNFFPGFEEKANLRAALFLLLTNGVTAAPVESHLPWKVQQLGLLDGRFCRKLNYSIWNVEFIDKAELPREFIALDCFNCVGYLTWDDNNVITLNIQHNAVNTYLYGRNKP